MMMMMMMMMMMRMSAGEIGGHGRRSMGANAEDLGAKFRGPGRQGHARSSGTSVMICDVVAERQLKPHVSYDVLGLKRHKAE